MEEFLLSCWSLGPEFMLYQKWCNKKCVHIISCSMSCLRFWDFKSTFEHFLIKGRIKISVNHEVVIWFNYERYYLTLTCACFLILTINSIDHLNSKKTITLQYQITNFEVTPLIENGVCMYDTMNINMVLKCL